MKKNKEAGVKELAEQEFQLGLKYMYGNGVEVDYEEAWRWFLRAAEKEHAEARRYLYILVFGIPLENVDEITEDDVPDEPLEFWAYTM